jgi:hypothetical protein
MNISPSDLQTAPGGMFIGFINGNLVFSTFPILCRKPDQGNYYGKFYFFPRFASENIVIFFSVTVMILMALNAIIALMGCV